MKKSLIALAVAGAFAAPAFAATSNVDVYGIMSVAIEDVDTANSEIQVVDRVSRIGFKGAEDLGGGLKAVWQIEHQISATGGFAGTDGVGGSQSLAGRNTFVGLAGGFGTFVVGRHDTPYKLATGALDPFADTMGDYNFGPANASAAGGTGLVNSTHDMRTPSAIAYISPTFSGFHAAAAVITSNTASTTQWDYNNKTIDAVSLMGMYNNGPLVVSLAYQSAGDAAAAAGDQEADAWKLGVGYKFGDLNLGFIYEDLETAGVDTDSWLLNATYNMGPIALKASYGVLDDDDATVTDKDDSMWVIGADYNLSKRTKAYILFANSENEGVDTDGWALGMKHSF